MIPPLEGNVAFTYLDAFDTDKEGLQAMKDHYVRGGLGDSKVKARLEGILQDMLRPIRERRQEYEKIAAMFCSYSKKALCVPVRSLRKPMMKSKLRSALKHF